MTDQKTVRDTFIAKELMLLHGDLAKSITGPDTPRHVGVELLFDITRFSADAAFKELRDTFEVPQTTADVNAIVEAARAKGLAALDVADDFELGPWADLRGDVKKLFNDTLDAWRNRMASAIA